MGIGGVDELAGFTEFNLDDARIKQQAMGYCRRCLVVADASKLGQVAFAKVAGIDEVDALITDSRAEPERLRKLREAGLEVIAA
jgi:DeoR/GlpR family transcriptional regulator of sugar metabolism